MIQLTIDTEIARPVREVFDYITDPAKLATWQTNTISAVAEPSGPLGAGSRLREVHRAPGGKQLASLVEIAEYAPDQAFALHMIEGALPIDAAHIQAHQGRDANDVRRARPANRTRCASLNHSCAARSNGSSPAIAQRSNTLEKTRATS